MAFKKKINDLRGILTLMFLTLPSIAANIDCNGRPFHCVNSTHFMICVDLGSGVSSTIDDFVIPCPPTTVCQGTNRFECEFPAVSTVTSAPLKPSVSETIGVETTPVYEVTTSIPYEEYYDTVSTTTLSEDILLTQLEIVTKSILPVTEKNKSMTITGSNYNLNDTVANFEHIQNETTNFLPFLPNNLESTVTELTTSLNEISVSEINSTWSEAIASVDVVQNGTITITPLNNTISKTITEVNLGFTENAIAPLTEPVQTLRETIASVDVSLTETASTTPLSLNIDTIATEAIINPNEISESGMNFTKSETIASVGAAQNDSTTITPLNNTVSITVTENITFTEPINTLSETIASAVVSFNETASTLLSINIDTTVSEATTNPNDIPESAMNFTKSETIASVDVGNNYTTTLTPLNNTISIPVTEVNLGFTEDVNILLTEPINTLSEAIASVDVSLNETASTTPIASVDVVQNDNITIITPLNITRSITVTEINLGFAENLNIPLTEPVNIMSETIVSADVALIKTTSPTPFSNSIDTTVTEVTTNSNKMTETGINIKSETIASLDVIQKDTTRLTPLNKTISIPVTEINLGFTDDVNVSLTESINTLNVTIASVDVLQNETTTITFNMENTLIEVLADLDAKQNGTSTVISSDNNTNINVTKVTPAEEIAMPISESNSPLDEVIGINDVNQNYTISLLPLNNNNSATEIDFTKIPDPEAESTQSETISSISSTSEPYIVADIITESIFKEASITTSTTTIDTMQETPSTFNIPNNTTLSFKRENFVTEAINSNPTENINLVNPSSIPNVSEINSSDNLIQTEQTTPYTWASISVPIDKDGTVTETIVAGVIDNINHELNTTPSINNAGNEHTTVKDILNANIGLDIKVSNVSKSKNAITTEPKSILTDTVKNYSQNVEEHLTTSFTPSTENLSNNDTAKDSKLIDNTNIKRLENTVSTSITPTVAIINTVGVTTPSTFNAASLFSHVIPQTIDVNQSTSQEATSLYITKENKTESITVDNMLIDSTVTDIHSSITTERYNNNADILYTSKTTLAKTTSSYHSSTGGITITNNNNDALKTTPKSMSSIALPEIFESSSYYSNVYYYPDTENIANGPSVLINQTDGKPIHSEKVLSTGYIDTVTTQVIAVRTDKLVTGTPVSATNTYGPYQETTEASPSFNTPKLILNTEPAMVTKQKTNRLESSTLLINDKIFSQLANLDTSIESFQKVNISNSNVVAKSKESVPTVQTPNESVNLNAIDKSIIDASETIDTRTEFAVSDGIVFITHKNLPADSSSIMYTSNTAYVRPDNFNEDIVTEQSTLATTLFVTETNQGVSTEPSNVALNISTSLTSNILPNQINMNKINHTETIISNATITGVPNLTTNTDSSNDLKLSQPQSEDHPSDKAVIDINTKSTVIADGNGVTDYLSSEILKAETLTENTMKTEENHLGHVTLGTRNSLNLITFNEVTLLTENNTISAPGLSTTTEIIAAKDAIKSNAIPLLDKAIDKSQSDVISFPVQATVSSLTGNKFQSDLVSVLDNILDIEALSTTITERLDSVTTESIILENAIKKEILSTIPKRNVTNSPRFLTEGTESSETTTESYHKVNEAITTIATVGEKTNNNFINNEQARRQQNSNLLLKMIINSDIIQTQKKERTIPGTWDYIPASLINMNEVTETSSIYTQTPTVAFQSSTKKATYKEHMELTPPQETILNGKGIHSVNQNADYAPLTEITTSAIQQPAVQTNASLVATANAQPQIEILQSDKAVSERIVDQFSIGNVMNSTPRDITATAHSNVFPIITENIQAISTILSQEQVTATNHVGMYSLQNQENIGFKQTSTPPITDIMSNHSNTPSHFVNNDNVQTETSYKVSIPDNERPLQIAKFTNVGQGVGSNIFKTTSQVPEAPKSSLDTVIQTQRTRVVTTSLPTKSPNVHPANVNQASHKTGKVTEAWRATVLTKQTIPITKPNIAVKPEQQIILAGPNPKSWKQLPTISEATAKPLTEINVQHVTSPSITIDQSSIDITSSSLTTETWRIPETSTNAADPVVKIINVSKNNVIDQTTQKPMKTEFINIQIVGQNTDKMTTPILETNLPYTGVVMMDILKTVTPILDGNRDSSTHSGISVIPKPLRKSEQSEQLEASESVELSESKEGKERTEKPRGKDTGKNLDASINYKGEKSTATPLTGKNKSKLDTAFEIKENTAASRSTITVKSIEMTTKKIEERPESGFRSITNIEQLSSTVRPDLKDKLLQNDSIVTANIESNRTNVKNSTAHYIPQTKSSFTNTHNTPVPAFKTPTTITRNFVCKPNNRGRFSDNKDCRKFYICIGKSEPIEGTCPNNTVFSVLRKQCIKNLSHCVRNNQFQCISEGRFSDYFTNNIYYICVKNNVGTFIRFKLQCQSGYHLNKTSIRCVLNTEPSQSTSQQSISDVSKDSNQSVSSARSEKLVREPSKTNKFECEKEGKFPNADSCRKYYVCKKIGKSKYRQKSKNCDSDELFHKDKKRCVDADSYECS